MAELPAGFERRGVGAHRGSGAHLLGPGPDRPSGQALEAGHRQRDLLRRGDRVSVAGVARPVPELEHVHRYHLAWSRDGTWERIVDRLRGLVREREGRDAEPSAGIVDARTVQGASTVGSQTRGFDGGKRISGRKTFGVVDTLGLLVAVVVVAAGVSDNAGGCSCIDRAAPKSSRLRKLWSDAGFKRAFARHWRTHKIKNEVVSRANAHTFEVLPRRWVVERTWAWLVNHRRLRIDYERHPAVTRNDRNLWMALGGVT